MEKQIGEHEKTIVELKKAVIKLKRARNALLNISTLPPEVLGEIFQCNVTLKRDFDGLEKGSYNFLFVCHHWLEVGLRTPEVRSFWGNTLVDWVRHCRPSGNAPLDLVLDDDDDNDDTLDTTLHDALQDRATRDAIRRIHLRSSNPSLLDSIVSSLTVACEGVRSNSVESFILINGDDLPVDVSDFLAHSRFPRLQHLVLDGHEITSWDFLKSRTAALTTLILHPHYSSPPLTFSQSLSILASHPTLRKLSLDLPDDGDGGAPLRVPLHHLKEIKLTGTLRDVLGFLHQLDHPGNMDDLDLTLFDCLLTDIPRTLGPYLRDHFRRRGRSRNGLELNVSQSNYETILRAGDMSGTGLPTPEEDVDWFLSVALELVQTSRERRVQAPGDLKRGVLDLIAHTPREDILSFRSACGITAMDEISMQFPNLSTLHFDTSTIPLPAIFPESKRGEDEKVLPSLQHIFLECADGDDWSPLVTFLARRASSGKRLNSLTIHESHMCLEVKECIRSMVQVLQVDSNARCPFGTCPEQ